MHARRAIAPIGMAVVAAYLACAEERPGAPALDPDAPVAAESLAVADAPRTVEELRARIAAVLAREHVHGAAIALVDRSGPTWVGGIGVRDVATGAPMDGDTMFRVGSLTKSVVALGVVRLAEQGKLDLDAPLRLDADIAIDNPWQATAPVTLAQCLEHTAGLDEVRPNEVYTTDEDLPVHDALLLNPRSRVIRWQPGTRHAYSNVGYTLAARAIELATGEPFDAYLRREILAPLGIRDSDFRRTEVIAAHLATGYIRPDRADVFRIYAHRPSGALLASAGDLAKLVHFWIRRGEGFPPIVSPAGLARIEHSGTLPYGHLDGEYGFAMYGDVSHPVFSRGHDGGMPGFHSSLRYFPELGSGYVLLLNSAYVFRGYFQIRSLLYAYLARDHRVDPPPPATTPDRPGATFFAFASPRNSLFDFVDRVVVGWRTELSPRGVAVTALRGGMLQFVPAHDGGYRLPRESGSSLRFTTSPDGTPLMVSGFWYAEAAPRMWAEARYFAVALAMSLLRLAPLVAAALLGYDVLRRRRVTPPALVLWPAIAGLCCSAMPHLLGESFLRGVIGEVHPLTVGLCATTILFGVSAAASVIAAVRWSVRPDRPPLLVRVAPTACALAAAGIALWFGLHGLIGLRTWAW